MSSRSSSRSEFSMGWRPLVASLLGVACGASPLPFNVISLIMGPLNAEFGWSFTAISAGITIFGLIASLSAPVFGGLSDRYGVRPVALISLLAFALTFSSFYFMPGSLIAWFGIWAIVGLVGIGSTPVTFSRAVNLWFSRHRGLALGIMLLGTSLAGLVVPQIANWAINQGGWRAAFPILALLPLLIGIPAGLLWFREPRLEERPAELSNASGQLTGLTFAQAIRGYRFWLLIGTIFIIAIAHGGIHVHMAQIVKLHGFAPTTAAGVMGMVALGIFVGRVGIGMLFDRFWAPAIAFPAMLLPACACYLLMGTGSSLDILLVGAFLLGFAAGAESDVIAFLAARYFGMRHYGSIYGALYMPFGMGSSISPLIYGATRDHYGNYDVMLTAAACMFAVGGALLLLLGRYPDLGATDEQHS